MSFWDEIAISKAFLVFNGLAIAGGILASKLCSVWLVCNKTVHCSAQSIFPSSA